MKFVPSPRSAQLAVAALLFAPALAFAQTSTPQPASPAAPVAPPQSGAEQATPPAPGAGMATGQASGESVQQRVEQHIGELKTELKITPAEQTPWNRFAAVMRENARDMDTALEQREHAYPTMTAVQNMRSYGHLAQLHAQHLEQLTSAFDTLYQALPAPQRKLADDAFRTRTEERSQARPESGSSK